MKEPSLEDVLECLADIGKECKQTTEEDEDVLNLILRHKNFDRELWQILYYCQQERTSTFENDIRAIPETDPRRQNIIDAIIQLYPITKNVINRMIRKRNISLEDCLEIVKFNDQLIDRIRDSLQEIKQNRYEESNKISRQMSELDALQKEIDELKEQKDKIVAKIKDYDKKRAERENLKQEIQIIEQEGGIDQEILNLKKQKESLLKQKEKKGKERDKLKGEITKLEEHLRSNAQDEQDQKYTKALNALQNCIKAMSNER